MFHQTASDNENLFMENVPVEECHHGQSLLHDSSSLVGLQE